MLSSVTIHASTKKSIVIDLLSYAYLFSFMSHFDANISENRITNQDIIVFSKWVITLQNICRKDVCPLRQISFRKHGSNCIQQLPTNRIAVARVRFGSSIYHWTVSHIFFLFYTFSCKIYRKNPNHRSNEINLITNANLTFSPQECQKCRIQTNKHK